MKTFYAWLVKSSEDPEKTSLTVKGTLLGFSSYALLVANVLHVHMDIGQYTQSVDTIVTLLGTLLTLYHSASAAYGFIRKLYSTAIGTNKVINSGSAS